MRLARTLYRFNYWFWQKNPTVLQSIANSNCFSFPFWVRVTWVLLYLSDKLNSLPLSRSKFVTGSNYSILLQTLKKKSFYKTLKSSRRKLVEDSTDNNMHGKMHYFVSSVTRYLFTLHWLRALKSLSNRVYVKEPLRPQSKIVSTCIFRWKLIPLSFGNRLSNSYCSCILQQPIFQQNI